MKELKAKLRFSPNKNGIITKASVTNIIVEEWIRQASKLYSTLETYNEDDTETIEKIKLDTPLTQKLMDCCIETPDTALIIVAEIDKNTTAISNKAFIEPFIEHSHKRYREQIYSSWLQFALDDNVIIWEEITILSSIPPKLGKDVFAGDGYYDNFIHCDFYVPDDAVEEYINSDWKYLPVRGISEKK